jgi:hypothetical protein
MTSLWQERLLLPLPWIWCVVFLLLFIIEVELEKPNKHAKLHTKCESSECFGHVVRRTKEHRIRMANAGEWLRREWLWWVAELDVSNQPPRLRT